MTTWSTTTLPSLQSLLNSLEKVSCFFLFTTLLLYTTTHAISNKNPFLCFSQFSPQNHPYNPTNTSFLHTSVILHLLIFLYNLPNNLHQKYFPTQPLSQFRLRQETTKLGCLVRTDTVLISQILVQSMDSENRAHNYWLLIAQFQKIGVLLVEVPDKDACNLNGKPSNPPSSHILNLFSLLRYPTNTTTRTNILLETSYTTWFLYKVLDSVYYSLLILSLSTHIFGNSHLLA